MADDDDALQLKRQHWIALIVVPVLYQLYVWVRSLSTVASFRQMFVAMLGSEAHLPFVTRFVLTTSGYWVIIPLGMAAAIYQFHRSARPTATHAIALIAVGAVLGIAMSSLIQHGLFAPLLELQKKLSH